MGGFGNRRAPDELGSSAAAEGLELYVITKTHGYTIQTYKSVQ